MSTIQDTDFLLVNRGGTDYKTRLKDLDLYINPVPYFVTASVGTASADWSPYVSLVEYPNGNDIPDSEFFYWPKENRDPARIFTLDNFGQPMGYDAACNTQNILIFAPDDGIRVYESITIRAGFNDNVNWGIMEINKGEIYKELYAPNLDPKEFTIPYEGVLDEFSIRQRDEWYEPAFNSYSWAPSIKYIKIDGNQLLNQLATTLTFTDDEFFDRLKVGTRLKQLIPEDEAVVSAIGPISSKTVILEDLHPIFVTGSTIVVVGEEE